MVTPDSFFDETSPPPRIIGTECEYQIQNGGIDTGHISNYIDKNAVLSTGLRYAKTFLSNGARLYADVEHAEYATPECLGPRQAAAADLAGVSVVAQVIEASGRPYTGIYRNSGTFLDQREPNDDGVLVGDNGNTRGYHESYLMPRSLEDNKSLEKIIPSFLATRLWAMSGALRSHYVLSQKVWGHGGKPIIKTLSGRITAGEKPMVIIPPTAADADVMGNPNWARLEVRFADPGLSPTVRFLGLAATSLVLRMVEFSQYFGNSFFCNLELINPVESAKLFAADLSLKKTVQTVSGKMFTALDIQEQLAESAICLSEVMDIPDDEKDAAYLWLNIVERMKNSNPRNGEWGTLIKELDVAAKHYYLSKRHPHEEQNIDCAKAAQISIAWDRISPESGGQKWWAAFPSKHVAQAEIDNLVMGVPRTRASIRATEIAQHGNDIVSVKWTSVVRGKTHIDLSDPYISV